MPDLQLKTNVSNLQYQMTSLGDIMKNMILKLYNSVSNKSEENNQAKNQQGSSDFAPDQSKFQYTTQIVKL